MRKKAYVEFEHGTLKWEADTLTTTFAVLISLPCPIPTICCNLCRAWIHLDVSCKSLNTDRRWRALTASYCNKLLKRTRYIPGVSCGRCGCGGGGGACGLKFVAACVLCQDAVGNWWPRASARFVRVVRVTHPNKPALCWVRAARALFVNTVIFGPFKQLLCPQALSNRGSVRPCSLFVLCDFLFLVSSARDRPKLSRFSKTNQTATYFAIFYLLRDESRNSKLWIIVNKQ